MDNITARWKRLSTMLTDNVQRIQELMAKLLQFEVGRATSHNTCPTLRKDGG